MYLRLSQTNREITHFDCNTFDSHGIVLLNGALAYALGYIEPVKHWGVVEDIPYQQPLHPFLYLKPWKIFVLL